MCGRFSHSELTFAELADMMRGITTPLVEFKLRTPRYNVAPTQSVPVIRQHDDHLELTDLRWGLIPHWAHDASIGNRLINARGETVASKPSFRESFRSRRCIVPVSGFYEWKKPERQPFYFQMSDSKPFVLAGLWDKWGDVESFTVITTTANALVAPLHDRMPVILEKADLGLWLDQKVEDAGLLQPLIHPLSAEKMVSKAVNKWVNKATNEGPECVAPAQSETLF
jgi:putative SOS response-associated peptidase YedK